MTAKEQIMGKIQEWVTKELTKNKLQIILENPELAEVDLEKITLINIDAKTVYTADNSRDYNEYFVLAQTFDMGNGLVVELSMEEDDAFNGIYALDDYSIYYDSDDGIDFYKRLVSGEDKTFAEAETHPLEVVFNQLNYATWALEEIMGTLISEFVNEKAKKDLLPVEEAQGIFDKVVSTEAIGMDYTQVTFASGASIRLDNVVIGNMKKMKKAK